MSRRMIRKVQGDTNDLKLLGNSESDDADFSPSKSRKKPFTNPYELLSREETPSDNEAKEDDDENENDAEEKDEAHAATDSLKRKRKKKRKKQKEIQEDEEEDIDATVEEINKMMGEPSPTSASNSKSASIDETSGKELLSIDYRNLNAENELKRIFGSKVIQAEMGKRKSKGRVHVRPSRLVTPKPTWPQVGKSGVKMNHVESRNGIHFFCFEHSLRYQQIQFQYLDAVESANPGNIVTILNVHPYHIDALLQLSDIVRMGEDIQMATDLIERALHCFENSFHPLFNLARGNCQLDYRYAENRAFFIALYKHLVSIGKKGCHRTALEFCKLLLSLSSSWDPLGVVLVIDYYAIRAGEYAFLQRFFDEFEPTRSLSLLPNFAFSMAMATFLSAENNLEEADMMLQKALIMFPGVLTPLLQKCGVQPDPRVTKHSFFGPKAQSSQSPALNQLVNLYVCRCFFLWKEPEVLAWLEKNVHQVLERVDCEDPLVAQCESRRRTCFQGATPSNVNRHLALSAVEGAAPVGAVGTSFDPWPPTDRITTYSRPPRPARVVDDTSILQTLLRSILPSYSMEMATLRTNQDAGVAEGGPEAGAVGGAVARDGGTPGASTTNDLRWCVTSLLDAMRDLLNNIHQPDVAQDGDDDDDNYEDEDNDVNRDT